MTGAATLEYLDALGATFAKVQPHLPGTLEEQGRCDGKDAIGRDFYDHPHDLAAAVAHFRDNPRHQNNVGMLTGKASGGLIVLDADAGARDLLTLYPELAVAPDIERDNAPDRVKFIVYLAGDEADIVQKVRSDAKDKPTHKLEVLGTGRQAVVVGKHKTGVEIKLHLPPNCAIPMFTQAQINDMMRLFVPVDYRDGEKPTTQRKQANPPTISAPIDAANMTLTEQRHAAIDEYNNAPATMACVDTLLAARKSKGAYLSIRANDDKPSTLASTDGFYKRTWFDFGTQATYDNFELECLLTGKDKTQAGERILNDWRAARGMLPVAEALKRGRERTQRQQSLRTLAPVARKVMVTA